MSKRAKAMLIHIVGLIVCIVPPALAALDLFPLLSETPQKQISTVGALMLLLCCVPLWRSLKVFLRSPSAWKLWLVVYVVFYLLSAISEEITTIALIGLASSVLGEIVFVLEKRYRIKNDLRRTVKGDV
jgi:chromate transport protein ChrA